MSKVPPKKGSIKKQEFDLDSFKNGFGIQHSPKEKPLEVIHLSEAFYKATGNAGLYKGYVNVLQGWPETGKSTGIMESVVTSQKMGWLPIIIDTEGNFNWEYARSVGMEYEEVLDEEGNVIDYRGFFIFVNNTVLLQKFGRYKHDEGKEGKESRSKPVIEDVALIIESFLDEQKAGKLPYDLVIHWDSCGSISSYKSVMSKCNNNQWDAGAISQSFSAILNFRIPSSRLETSPYTNTLVIVQKIWYDGMNMEIKGKGGRTLEFGSRFIVRFGNVLTSGAAKIKAKSGDKVFYFGTESRVKVVKNQITGLSLEGKIVSTPWGYVHPDEVDGLKKTHRDFILIKLGLKDGEISIEKDKTRDSDIDLDDN